jgi:ferritin-like metal-binding protein YciE
MRLNSFENLFADQLNDLYSAENQLIQALPKMAEAATTPELQQAFTQHLEETRGHAEIVKQLLTAVGEKAGGEKCKGMEGLLKEGEEVLEKRGDSAVKDAALIASAQRVEHYEIAGYGTARAMAKQLGNNEAANRLQEILDQESRTDELLTQIATGMNGAGSGVNQEAAGSNGSQRSNRR